MKFTFSQLFERVLSIPKSLFVSLHYFPLKEALKLPIMVRYNCQLIKLRGCIKIVNGGVKTGLLSLGFHTVGIFDKKYERCSIQMEGCIKLYGKASLGQGCRICIGKEGCLSIGKNFFATANFTIICMKRILLGNDILASWDSIIMDTDFHKTINLNTNSISTNTEKIIIEDNVWIGMRCTILKGSSIPKGCIIAANSVLCKKFVQQNCLLAGNPAILKRANITIKR